MRWDDTNVSRTTDVTRRYNDNNNVVGIFIRAGEPRRDKYVYGNMEIVTILTGEIKKKKNGEKKKIK